MHVDFFTLIKTSAYFWFSWIYFFNSARKDSCRPWTWWCNDATAVAGYSTVMIVMMMMMMMISHDYNTSLTGSL